MQEGLWSTVCRDTLLREARVQVDTRESQVRTHDSPLEGSPPAYRHCFCATCDSALPLVWDQLPFVEVPVSSLDAPVESRSAYQMFECQLLEWISETNEIRWYERGAPPRDKVVRAVLR